MNKNWESVEKIIDGVTAFCENDINPILSQLEGRTDDLKSAIERLTGSCGLIVPLHGFMGDYKAGQLIAMDDSGRYVAASSSVRDLSYDNSGALKPGTESFVIGMLLADVDDSGTAMVMCSGWTNDATLIEAATNNQGTGRYYLGENGQASKVVGDLQHTVYCFSVSEEDTGSRLIFNPRTPEHNGHTHNLYKLNGTWEQVPLVPPQLQGDVAYRLDISNSPELKGLLSRGSDKNTLIKNGELIDPTKWCIDTDGEKLFIVVAMTVIDSDILYLSATFPLIGTTPSIRGISSLSNFLSVYNVAGDISIDVNPEYLENESADAKAIKCITTDGLEYIPVVSQIRAGAGTVISAGVDADGNKIPGAFDIHTSSNIGNQLDFNITNLDGVIFGTSEDSVSYQFPANTVSAIHGTVRAPNFDSNNVRYRLNVLVAGNSSAPFSGRLKIYRWPGSALPNDSISFSDLSVESSSGDIYLYTTDFPVVAAASNDFIVLTLKADNPSSTTQVITASLEMYINE